jgi:hypothetical protein
MQSAHHHHRAPLARAARNRKGGVSAIVLVLAAAAVLVGAVLLFSKPWGQKLKDGIRGVTEWTPENIAADKAGYVGWAIGELQAQQKKLEGRALSLATQAEKARLKKEESAAKQKIYESLVADGKKAYKEAEAKNEWPDKWKDVKIGGKREFQVQILTANTEAQNAAKLVETYTVIQQRAAAKLAEVKDVQAKTKIALGRLETDREILKANEQLKGIEDLHEDVKNILVTSGVLVSDERTIQDVANENAQAAKSGTTEEDFAKLMAQ